MATHASALGRGEDSHRAVEGSPSATSQNPSGRREMASVPGQCLSTMRSMQGSWPRWRLLPMVASDPVQLRGCDKVAKPARSCTPTRVGAEITGNSLILHMRRHLPPATRAGGPAWHASC